MTYSESGTDKEHSEKSESEEELHDEILKCEEKDVLKY
jgi:hypothetical protein